MVNYPEQIKRFEEELRKTKYNKRTQHHIGLVKAKIARLKERQAKRTKSKGKRTGYDVRKTGDGTVIIIGYPSVGKSTLLNKITNANSKIGEYDFTTLEIVPGLMKYKHAKIQILDVPGVIKGAASGKGRGKEVLSVMRTADLTMILIDVNHPEHLGFLKKEIYDSGLRLNEKKPFIKIKKTERNGIRVGTTVRLTKLTKETISGILKEFKINNADVLIRDNITADQLIDAIEANKIYIPAITVVNKIDTVDNKKLREAMNKTKADIAVSGEKGSNTGKLKEIIFKKLDLIRLYMKEPNKKPDMDVPLIIFNNAAIRDVCNKLHKDFISKFKFARVWGKSVKYGGQKIVKLTHKLADNDVLELRMR